jgi:predicted alpha/beta hydrolase
VHRLVTTADGHRIAARFFHPRGEPKGAVLIAPAMGVSQDYYQPFASWLTQQGYTAATFEYRGTGLSRPRALRSFKADIFDWARLDCATTSQ